MSDPSPLITLAPTAVALVALLIERFDRHKEAANKELDIPDALITLTGLVHMWAEQASRTNIAARRWVQEEMPRRKSIGRQPRSLQDLYRSMRGQEAIALDTYSELYDDSPKHNNLLRVLELYTPELTDQLVKATKQRRAHLTGLERELRMRQARDDRAVESYLDELDAAADRLEEASRQLDAYVRANVPIAGGN